MQRSSAKAKGWPLDAWRERHLGAVVYVHAVGFHVLETTRIDRDTAVTLGGNRHPIYPAHEWGWNRHDCRHYIWVRLRLWWRKSCCRQCPFAGGAEGWPDQLSRFQEHAEDSMPHLVNEHVAVSLNPRSALFATRGTLTDRLRADGATTVVRLAERAVRTLPWALYRVRRVLRRPSSIYRSVEALARGDRAAMLALLHTLAARTGLALDTTDGTARLWLARREPKRYPAVEALYVAAVDHVHDKARPGFDTHWNTHAAAEIVALDERIVYLAAAHPHAA